MRERERESDLDAHAPILGEERELEVCCLLPLPRSHAKTQLVFENLSGFLEFKLFPKLKLFLSVYQEPLSNRGSLGLRF